MGELDTPKYRDNLPHLDGRTTITCGGMETTFVFHEKLDLPNFAAFHPFKSEEGLEAYRRYFRHYADIAKEHNLPIIIRSATWRGSPEWGEKLGYSPEELEEANKKAIRVMAECRAEYPD